MATATAERPVLDPARCDYTLDDLEALPGRGEQYELVYGRIKEWSVSALSSQVAALIAHVLVEFQLHAGGVAFGDGIELAIDPAEPRRLKYKADGAYVAAGRLPGDVAPDGYLELAPDLVVEVVSPSNDASTTLAKVQDYLRLGVHMVWVVYPHEREVHVYTPGRTILRVYGEDLLEGGDVLPAFRVPVESLFPAVPKAEEASPATS